MGSGFEGGLDGPRVGVEHDLGVFGSNHVNSCHGILEGNALVFVRGKVRFGNILEPAGGKFGGLNSLAFVV
jgi:hypothetical protein